jgi:hypothetical protein
MTTGLANTTGPEKFQPSTDLVGVCPVGAGGFAEASSPEVRYVSHTQGYWVAKESSALPGSAVC